MENNEATPQAQPVQSFAERKAAQLSEERVGREADVNVRPDADLQETETPEPVSESEPMLDDPEYDIEATSSEEEYEEDVNPDEGTLDANPVPPEQTAEFWEKRFKDTQRKLSEVTENRTEIEREQVDMMSTTLELKHQLEDTFLEAETYANTFKGNVVNQIAQLEAAFNSGQIEPDHLPAARQQYQQLQMQRQHLEGQLTQIKEQRGQAEQVQRDRQAELSRMRLQRTIPDWSRDKYREIGEYAQKRGFTADEFNNMVDHRYIELLHDSMQLNSAGSGIGAIQRKKKASGPSRKARQQPRSADGKYRQAKQEFHDNPNQKGRFAEMKQRQLEKERRGR